jgi:predicted transcriptional regulator of viral defense system
MFSFLMTHSTGEAFWRLTVMSLLDILQCMDDIQDYEPQTKYERLFAVASGQQGYFTAAQARECGYGTDLLTYHTRTGKFIREQRGIYRLRDYPSSNRGWVVAAWLAAGKEDAVVSHESALDLLELSDVIPRYTHITVPRSKRYLRSGRGVKIHTAERPLGPREIEKHEGIRMTSPARTILDAAEAGTAPEQIVMAVAQALDRELLFEERLMEGVKERNGRVQRLIGRALDLAAA